MNHPSATLSRPEMLSGPPRRPGRGWTFGARTLVLAGGLLVAGISASGCATTGSAGYYEPDLVYVSPGVQVIADYDEPIFYADGYYWRNTGGAWYRSSYYRGGWAYAQPPGMILSINSPHRYRHYRPSGWAPRHRSPAASPVVRGGPPPRMMGAPSRGPGPSFGAAPGPTRGGPPGMAPGRAGPPAMAPGRAGPPPMGRSNPGPGHRGGPQPVTRPGAPFMGRGGPHR